jgi:steroid delta-isomerase-like uncharacterized protein
MSQETNKALVRRVFEDAMNQRRLDLLDELIAPTYVNYDMPAPAPGPEGLRQVVSMFFTAFPDMQITLDDVIAEGDRVSTRGSFRGTHQGEFMGIPATGKVISVQYQDHWRLENGRAVENWVRLDLLGLMQQLGVVPTPGQATT